MNKKKVAAMLLSLAMLGTGISVPVNADSEDAPMLELYVSPNGDDTSGSGSNSAPFKTLGRARDEVRKFNSDMTGDINVNVTYGTYFMEDTLSLTAEDSGTNGYRVNWRGIADGDNKPIISGGIDITDGWTVYDAENNIYKHENITWSFRQLYTNNSRAIRARYPNLENEETGGPYMRAEGGDGSYPLFIGKNNEYAQKAGDNAEIIWNSSWSQFRARIDYYDTSSGKVYFKFPDNSFAWNHHTQGNTPYFLENSLEYLDAEGEWFLDTENSTLYYKPRTGEVMNETEIIAPKLETIVDIRGSDADNRVENITFDGLRFLHSNWLAPNSYGYCSVQGGFRYQSEGGSSNSSIRGSARYDAPKSMVQLTNTNGIELLNSEFSFSGSWGVMGYENTKNTLIDHNTFQYNAGGGVTMGMAGREWDDQTEYEKPREYTDMDGQSIYDTITNNYIDHVACEYQDMVGIGAMLPQNMTIANNEIGYLPYTGVNIGWNWLDTDHGMTGNMVYQNYIHDTCMLLQDGGGIYSLGRMNGDSNFYYNYITNIEMSEWAPHDNLMGIYFDNGSCYKKAQANVFDNTVYSFQASNPPNHDNIFEGNYYNCPKGISSIGSSASISNKPFSTDSIPSEVQNIIDHAGIDKDSLPNPSSRVNLAFRKSVTSSGSEDAHPASNAADGDSSTMWEQYIPEADKPDISKAVTSLMVDLENSYTIDEIMITFQYGNRSRYKIEYSTDGSSWNTCTDKLSQDPSVSESVYETAGGVEARYIKLTMDTQGWGAGVREIYVYSSDDSVGASAELSKTAATYDKNPAWKQEIKFAALQNGSSVTELKNGDYTLVPEVDYENHWGNITLKTSYLDTLSSGKHEITVEFDKSEAKIFTLTVEEDDGTSNIALNKPIEASSYNTDENRYAKYMVDGDSSTRWAQKQGTSGQAATVILDLEQAYDITKTSIDFELDSAGYNYKIEYSTNGDVWRTFVDKLSDDTQTRTVIDEGNITARYLRFTVNHNSWGASIWEIQVKGTPTTSTDELSNLALNKTITATTYNTDENRYSEYMVDGDSSTRWAQKQGTNGTHNTINLDLGKVYDVRSVIINWELAGVNYKIEYSEDGQTYETYADKLSETTSSADTEDTKQVNARYFRFDVNNDSWGASIWEIQVLGIDDEKTVDNEISEGVYVFRDSNGSYITAGENVPFLLDKVEGGYDEKWIKEDVDGTYFRLINALTGEALTYDGDMNSRKAVTAPAVLGDNKQLWQYTEINDKSYNIVKMLMNKDCGLMLQIDGGDNSSNGASLGLYWYEGWYRQHFEWSEEELSDGTVVLKNGLGTYLRAQGTGNNAVTWETTVGNAQKWEITKASESSYTITSVSSNKRITYNNGIILADANDSDTSQQWTVEKNSGLITKSCVFTNVSSGEKLIIDGISGWKYEQSEKDSAPKPYVTDIAVSGNNTRTVSYTYHAETAEGASEYQVYELDDYSVSSGKVIAEGTAKSGFTFDTSDINSDKYILVAITPKDINGNVGAVLGKYILPVKSQPKLAGSAVYEPKISDLYADAAANANGWSNGGTYMDASLEAKAGHSSALGLKSSEGSWWSEAKTDVDFSNSGNDFFILTGKAYVEYDLYIDPVDNIDAESQMQIGLKCDDNIFAAIQERGRVITLAAGGGDNIAKLYPIGTKDNMAYKWINVKYYVDTENNKFAIALDNKFMTSDDGTIWFAPTHYNLPHNDGKVITVDKVSGFGVGSWWQSEKSGFYIDNVKTGTYSEAIDEWSVVSAETIDGTLESGKENSVMITVKETSPVQNGKVYVGLYKDGVLLSAAVNKSVTFDENDLNTDIYKLTVPEEAGDYSLRVFLWKDSMTPITNEVYEKNFTVTAPAE